MKPILFSTAMVQAILAGRKTQTRRVIIFPHNDTDNDVPERCAIDNNGRHCFYLLGAEAPMWRLKPRYKPGDILWVRETWRETGVISQPYAYKAHEQDMVLVGEDGNLLKIAYKYKPSIFMPREAARIFLEVEDVRAERVQDMDVVSCVKEGVTWDIYPEAWTVSAKPAFIKLWDSLNAKRGYGWEVNPWVWAYTFKPISKEEALRKAG